jgi:hypothetical protein
MAKGIKRDSMRGFATSIAAALCAASLSQTATARSRAPLVVELYTAQGCSACLKANLLLDSYAGLKHAIALTFSVDYWDYLGWRDTFAQPAFTDRQRAYADRLKVRSLNTPEFVIDGAREASGPDNAKIDLLIDQQGGDPPRAPSIHLLHNGTKVEIGAGPKPSRGGDVWLIRYDPTRQEVTVKTGENKGKVVSARNVVEELDRLGAWSGRRRSYTLPKASDPSLKTVILVQGAKGGRILAAYGG